MQAWRELIVVRHGRPDIVSGVAAPDWSLAADARVEVRMLAQRLEARLVVSSQEPKALQTAELLEPVELVVDPRLDEVARPLDWDDSYAETVERYLMLGAVDGWEPADSVRDRVTRATGPLPTGAVVVGHGIALALLVSVVSGQDPVAFWNQLRMPDAWLVTPSRLQRL